MGVGVDGQHGEFLSFEFAREPVSVESTRFMTVHLYRIRQTGINGSF
jgi:hypothetical protein